MRRLAVLVSLALALQLAPGASRPHAQTDDVPVHHATVDAKDATASAMATVSGLGTGAPAPSPAASAVPGPRPSNAPDANGSAPAHLSGTATWYCGHGSPCTIGHRPSQMAAAASRALQRLIGPGWRGTRVLVASRGQGGVAAVVVTLVDTCGCPGGRVIDLYSSAWGALGQPLSRGVLPVTVEVAR